MRTRANEKITAGIAKRLVRAIADIERYDGDPDDVFDDARVVATQYSAEVRKIVKYLSVYYFEA